MVLGLGVCSLRCLELLHHRHIDRRQVLKLPGLPSHTETWMFKVSVRTLEDLLHVKLLAHAMSAAWSALETLICCRPESTAS